MHKSTLVAASLLTVAACGTVQDMPGGGSDDGPQPLAIVLMASQVHDEVGDTIDFSTGEPVHSHEGPLVDLASAGCPVVHKYGYLIGPSEPTFGRQTSKNPLAWTFAIQGTDVDASSFAYRVRDAANALVVDWTTLPEPHDGIYTIELDRRVMPQLASVAGQFRLEVRARDLAGAETVASWCWDHEPLAAPLGIGALARTSGGLFAMTLPADSPISSILTTGTGPTIAEQSIVQYTSDPIRIALDATVAGQYSKRVFSGLVKIRTGSTLTFPRGIDPGLATAPKLTTTAGPIVDYTATASVFDTVTGARVIPADDGTITIPARASADAPHAYRIVVSLGQVAQLRPGTGIAFAEYTAGATAYTGTAPGAPIEVCAKPGVCGATSCSCDTAVYQSIVALDNARLDFDAVSIDLAVSPSTDATPTTPSYVTAGLFTTTPMSWDAGDDNLDGY